MQAMLDRFVRKHPNFGLPRLMLYVVIGNLIVFCFDLFSNGALSDALMFSRADILRGEVWRVVTFLVVPTADRPLELALSLYFYYFIGTSLEQEWGTAKFSLFYAVGVVLNIAVGFAAGYATMHYVNLSMFFAFATLYPELQFYLFFLIPVKAKWLAWLDGALFVVALVGYALVGAYLWMLLPVVAILNYLLFFWDDIIAMLTRHAAHNRRQRSQQAIQFRAAQKKARETKGYLHKCAVCGVTDADDPTMEFRYCSKCDGYYCYCMEHINDHPHVHKEP